MNKISFGLDSPDFTKYRELLGVGRSSVDKNIRGDLINLSKPPVEQPTNIESRVVNTLLDSNMSLKQKLLTVKILNLSIQDLLDNSSNLVPEKFKLELRNLIRSIFREHGLDLDIVEKSPLARDSA